MEVLRIGRTTFGARSLTNEGVTQPTRTHRLAVELRAGKLRVLVAVLLGVHVVLGPIVLLLAALQAEPCLGFRGALPLLEQMVMNFPCHFRKSTIAITFADTHQACATSVLRNTPASARRVEPN